MQLSVSGDNEECLANPCCRCLLRYICFFKTHKPNLWFVLQWCWASISWERAYNLAWSVVEPVHLNPLSQGLDFVLAQLLMDPEQFQLPNFAQKILVNLGYDFQVLPNSLHIRSIFPGNIWTQTLCWNATILTTWLHAH